MRLLRRYTPQQILVSALIAGTAAGLLLVMFAATGFGGLGTLLASLWLVLAAAGLALPNAPALAMSRHSEAAGTAAALLGAVQFGIGAVSAPLAGLFGTGSVPMAIVIAGGMAAALIVMLACRSARQPRHCRPGPGGRAALARPGGRARRGPWSSRRRDGGRAGLTGPPRRSADLGGVLGARLTARWGGPG